MKITKIDIPSWKIPNGLESIKMDKLGSVVLLAGKNGSGKTRLLELIRRTIKEKPTSSQVNTAQSNINNCKRKIEGCLEKINKFMANTTYEPNLLTESSKDRIKFQERDIASNEKLIASFSAPLNWKLIETDGYYPSYNVVNFAPKVLKIENPNGFTKTAMESVALNLNELGIGHLHIGTFARIQYIQDRWYNCTHPQSLIIATERENLVAEYEELNKLIKLFLDVELGRDVNGNATLFNFPIGQCNLSDGQCILIQFCLAIHCQKKSLNELIIFLDEPENHLHPSVLIDAIENIRSKSSGTQIWIATHSIPLLSYFDPSSIWFVDRNTVAYAGTIPEKVLSSLIGNESDISKLQDFISLPGIFALNRHAFESLFHPQPADTGKEDPQTLQIREEIRRHLNSEQKIRILDFGVGRGRLLANILENNKEPKEDLIKWFDYVAFDKFNTGKVECESRLQTVYDDWNTRYFNDFSSLRSLYDKESFDVVIMCNVLHEIEPNQWLKLFSNTGDIYSLLSDKGILLLVEDQEMPIGEKAYQKGFIVLNTPEIKELFSIKENDIDFGFSDARNDGRLKAHRISKEYLSRISSGTIKEALRLLNRTAKEKILRIRTEEINYKNGKRHGFWIQQLANTSLALEEL